MFHEAQVHVDVLSAMTGDVLWSGQVDPRCTAGLLSRRVALDVGRPGKVLSLQHQAEVLGPASMLIEATAAVECLGTGAVGGCIQCPEKLSFSGVWSTSNWPVAPALLQLWLERSLEPYLERAPRWRQLRTSQAMGGFVKGVLQRLDEDVGKLAAGKSSEVRGPGQVFEMLGLPAEAFERMDGAVKERLQHLWSLADRVETEASLQELVGQICRQAALADQEEAAVGRQRGRRLVQWPTKRDPKTAVALLLTARLWELSAGEPMLAAEVDAAVAEMFATRPDLPLIRRGLLELGFLEQPRLVAGRSTAEFTLSEETPQRVLDEILRRVG